MKKACFRILWYSLVRVIEISLCKVFVRKLTKILSSKGIQVLNSDQSQFFMKSHYPNCNHFKVYLA